MLEFLDILDEDGNLTSEKKSRLKVHRDGDWHRAIAIFILNNKNEILFQKRSTNKDSLAGMWASSIFGHVTSGQNSLQAAYNELKEEVGIDNNSFEYLGTAKETKKLNPEFIDNVFVDVYLINLDLDIKDFIIQKEELSELKWIAYEELRIMLQNNDSNLVNYSKVHDLLIEKLEKN